jgi:uncharacterized protein (TIGR02284 family)
MSRPSQELLQAESAVYSVIQSLIDSQEALVEIGEKLQDKSLKHFFLSESLKRAEFRGELEAILNQEGVSELRESGTTAGILHRAWIRLSSRFDGGDRTLLATAEQGEGAAAEAYGSAMNTPLPLPIRQVLSTQASHIHDTHDFVKAARDRIAESMNAA